MKLQYFDPTITVWGPNLNKKEKRRFVSLVLPNGTKTQKSYAKFLMENHLGRHLSSIEIVRHIDGDILNDVISNLEIITPSQNGKKNVAPAQMQTLICPWCKNLFQKTASYIRSKTKNNRKCYCSRQCSGKASASS